MMTPLGTRKSSKRTTAYSASKETVMVDKRFACVKPKYDKLSARAPRNLAPLPNLTRMPTSGRAGARSALTAHKYEKQFKSLDRVVAMIKER